MEGSKEESSYDSQRSLRAEHTETTPTDTETTPGNDVTMPGTSETSDITLAVTQSYQVSPGCQEPHLLESTSQAVATCSPTIQNVSELGFKSSTSSTLSRSSGQLPGRILPLTKYSEKWLICGVTTASTVAAASVATHGRQANRHSYLPVNTGQQAPSTETSSTVVASVAKSEAELSMFIPDTCVSVVPLPTTTASTIAMRDAQALGLSACSSFSSEIFRHTDTAASPQIKPVVFQRSTSPSSESASSSHGSPHSDPPAHTFHAGHVGFKSGASGRCTDPGLVDPLSTLHIGTADVGSERRERRRRDETSRTHPGAPLYSTTVNTTLDVTYRELTSATHQVCIFANITFTDSD